MNFIVNLSRIQKGFDSIFVVIDKLTKMARLKPTMIIVTTLGVAELFVKDIFLNYELLREIICDKHRKFMNEF